MVLLTVYEERDVEGTRSLPQLPVPAQPYYLAVFFWQSSSLPLSTLHLEADPWIL